MNSDSEHGQPKSSEWDCWVQQHAPRLLLYARQQTRCEADAQDLVQEAMFECWQRNSAESPPQLALVFSTIRRRAIDLARGQQRRGDREAAASDGTPTCWFDSTPERREFDRMLQDAMSRLPEIYREVITLKIWGDLTFSEIAGMLEISPNTAASRYRYAVLELRKLTKGVLA